jgi:hypothetical protein
MTAAVKKGLYVHSRHTQFHKARNFDTYRFVKQNFTGLFAALNGILQQKIGFVTYVVGIPK